MYISCFSMAVRSGRVTRWSGQSRRQNDVLFSAAICNFAIRTLTTRQHEEGLCGGSPSLFLPSSSLGPLPPMLSPNLRPPRSSLRSASPFPPLPNPRPALPRFPARKARFVSLALVSEHGAPRINSLKLPAENREQDNRERQWQRRRGEGRRRRRNVKRRSFPREWLRTDVRSDPRLIAIAPLARSPIGSTRITKSHGDRSIARNAGVSFSSWL